MSKAGENPLATEMEHILRVAAFCEKRHKLMENLLNTDRDTWTYIHRYAYECTIQITNQQRTQVNRTENWREEQTEGFPDAAPRGHHCWGRRLFAVTVLTELTWHYVKEMFAPNGRENNWSWVISFPTGECYILGCRSQRRTSHNKNAKTDREKETLSTLLTP